MPAAQSLITLLTDFGDRDYFVASMKGVILTINPAAHIVDLSHQVAPHDIAGAAYVLKSCYSHFPDGTIHVAVVDPGVGSARRPIIAKTARHLFVAPDNGLLSYVYAEEGTVEVRQIENPRYRLESQGATFDGRDVFAPAAAWLSQGIPPESFGSLVHDPVRQQTAAPHRKGQSFVGQIVYVDCFGNLISNLMPQHLKEAQSVTKRFTLRVHIGDQTIEGLVANYSEGDSDKPRALINSNGYLEVFVKEGRAADVVKAARGDEITIS